MHPKIEIAAFNLQSALIAAEAGVDRIEFCDDFSSGGVTPSTIDFLALKESTKIPVYVMIRPRGGNFVYSKQEIESMKNSIIEFKSLGADGFVFGVLDINNQIDKKVNKEFVKLCGSLPTTFHRAFDRTENPLKALEDCIDCGFSNILSSGREKSVIDGLSLLVKLQEIANKRIDFVAGGGIRSGNIERLIFEFKTGFYHSSAIISSTDIADIEELKLLVQAARQF